MTFSHEEDEHLVPINQHKVRRRSIILAPKGLIHLNSVAQPAFVLKVFFVLIH